MIGINEALYGLGFDGGWKIKDQKLHTWYRAEPQPTEEEIQAKIAELQAAEPLRQLREQRTRILQESDWMANSDVTMSDAWRNYRQALRDLPANSPNVALDEQGNLINVTWPTKPE